MRRVLREVDAYDVAFLVGFGLVVWGAARVSVTAAIVLAGLVLGVAGFIGGRSA